MVRDKAATSSKSEQVMDKATNLMLQDAGLPLTTGTNDTENEPLKPVMMNAVGPQYSGPESILSAEVKPHKNEIHLILSTIEKIAVSDGRLVQVRVFKICPLFKLLTYESSTARCHGQ